MPSKHEVIFRPNIIVEVNMYVHIQNESTHFFLQTRNIVVCLLLKVELNEEFSLHSILLT